MRRMPIKRWATSAAGRLSKASNLTVIPLRNRRVTVVVLVAGEGFRDIETGVVKPGDPLCWLSESSDPLSARGQPPFLLHGGASKSAIPSGDSEGPPSTSLSDWK